MIDPKTGKHEWVMGFGAKSQSGDILGYATTRSVYLGRYEVKKKHYLHMW